MYEQIVKLNPNIKIYRTSDKEFRPYGRVLNGIHVQEFMNAAKTVPMPESGSTYVPELDVFQNLAAAKDVQNLCFGELPTQAGYCYGYSNTLNAVEWHKNSEINIAITPFVLLLGQVQDIENNTIDSSSLKAFYVEKGEAIEVYATTLHFCPCQTEKTGFGCVVVLPAGTNIPLDGAYADKLLFRKNKWILCHVENTSLIERGVVAGVTGENYVIKF